jgi:hypothetical protein
MNINSNSNPTHLYTQNLANRQNAKTADAADAVSKSALGASGEKIELSKFDALRKEPEIRPEMVAKGKELLNDPNFPSKEIVDSIAKLIVPFANDE